MVDKRATLAERLLLWSGYATFFTMCFVMFAYWTFPYERVRTLIIARAATIAPGSKMDIEEVGPHWLTGITLSGVRMESLTKKKGEAASAVEIDELTISVSPIALAFGTTDVSFSADVRDGSLDGNFTTEEGGPSRLTAELDAVDLEALGVGAYLKVPMKGTMTGEVDVTLAPEPAATQGSVELQIDGFTVGDGKAKVPLPGWGGSGVTVPEIPLGTLVLSVPVKDGIATIEKLEAKSKDVSLAGSGSIRLLEPFSRSRADITLGIKVDEAYAKREDKIKLVVGMPQVKSATGADGMIRFGLSGNLTALKAKPAAAGGKAARRRPRPQRPKR